MTGDLQSFMADGPITQGRAEAAAEWMVHNAVAIAKAKARRDFCENRLRVVRSLEMQASAERSAAAQEREAYASERYQTALQELFDATVEHETLYNIRFAGERVIDVWRSINSTLKATKA